AVGGECLGEGGERAVDLAVRVRVLHEQADEHRSRLVGGGARAEGGLVAGGVADAGRARGEGHPEAADGRVLGARALGDDQGRARAGGGDRVEGAPAGDVRERPGGGVRGGGECLREGGGDAVDPAVAVHVLHRQRARHEHRLRPVRGGGGGEGGEVAGGVADAGGVGGEGDGEGPDGGVGGARPLADGEGGDGAGDGDGGERAPARDARERPGGGAGAVGGERLGEGGERAVDLAVRVRVLHEQADEHRSRLVGGGARAEGGLVAGGVADAGRARGEGDPEAADGGGLGARARG